MGFLGSIWCIVDKKSTLWRKEQISTKLGLTFGAFNEFSPRRSSELFVCIERQECYATVSCALDPEETLLYSKVTMGKISTSWLSLHVPCGVLYATLPDTNYRGVQDSDTEQTVLGRTRLSPFPSSEAVKHRIQGYGSMLSHLLPCPFNRTYSLPCFRSSKYNG